MSSSCASSWPLSCGGVGLLDLLDRAALHEQPLDRIERRQLVVPRLQRPHLGGDAEQLADEILEMRREIDQQVGFSLAVERLGCGARRHQPVVQRHVGRGEMRDKGAVEPHQTRRARKDRQRRARVSGRIRSWALVTRSEGAETIRQIAATEVAQGWRTLIH